MVMLFISLTCIMAQAVSEYTFATATNGSLEDMSTGTTTLLSGYSDSGATAVTDIGFTFTFSGTAYTQFSANANGLVRLGGTAIYGYSTSPVASAAILGPISSDNCIASTGKIHYKMIGSEAPRKLVIEFKDIRLPYGSSPGTGTLSTIQVWLNETSNVVDFVYGTMYNNSTSSISRGVFISTTNTTGNVGSVANITTTPSWVTTGTIAVNSSFTASSNMTNLHSAADGSRRVFSFSPPDPLAVPLPANVSSPGNAATGILRTATLNWASGGGLPTGYRLSFGTDNPPTNIVNNMDMGLVTTYDPNPDMAYGTTYYWKVVAYNVNGDAVGSPVWSFTTVPDPTVTVFPYTEGFESGNTQGSTSVSNWTQAFVTGTKYWTINSTNTSYNRTPRTGSFNTTLAYSASTWLFRPVQLIGGTSYDFEVWARQDNANSTYASMTLAYGDQATPAAMVNTIVTQTPLTNGDYQRLLGSFTPPTSGIYYLGILGTLPTSTNWYVSLDDITIRETPSVPIISVVPESWDFGTQLINTINPKEFTITNDGGAPLILSSVNVTGTGFALSGTFSQITLQPLENTTITVNFSPISEGVHNGSIAINDNRAVTNIPLAGTAIDVTIYAEDLPFLENFDSVSTPALPIGWSKRVTDTSTFGYVQTTTTGYSTPNRVVLYNSSDSASDLILITPPVDVELNTLRVKFMAYGGANYTLQVGTANSAGQDATFTPYQTVNPTASWNQFSVDFSAYAGTDQYIAFRHGQGGTYRSIYVDDVTIEEPLAIAPEVATLVYPADGLTTLLNPMLKWAASPTGEPAHGFKVYLNDTGTFTEGDLVYTGTATSFQTTLASYESSYFWKVVPYNAIGDATGASTWSFSTPTERQLAEGFELTAFPPAGWANGTSGSFTRSTTTPYEGLASAYKFTSTTVTYVLSTPMLTIVDGSMLEFYAHTTTANAYQTIQIATSPDRVTWTPLGTPIVLASAGPWQYYTVDLSSVPGNYFVGFQTPSVTSTGSIYIDHVIGPDVTPLLPGVATQTAPADAAVNQSNRPTLTWTAPVTGGIPTGYKVYCDTTNPPTTLVTTVTASPYTFTYNLDWEQTYYWSIVPTNSAGDAEENTVRSFTVMADPTIYVTPATPYSMNFDGMGTTFPPIGWSRLDGLYGGTYAAGIQWNQDDWLNVSTPTNKAAKLNIYGTDRYGWLVTPPVNIPADGYELKFDMGLLDWNGTIAPVAGEQADDKLIIVMSDSPTMSNPTILREWNNNGSVDVYDNIPHTGANYSVELTGISGTKYFAFYGESTVTGGDNDLMVDNVVIREIPAGAPYNVTLNSPANNAVGVNPAAITLSWTPAVTGGNADGYSILVGANPIDPSNEYFGEYEFNTTSTTFDLSAAAIVLGYEQTWHWAVWPYNGDPIQYPDPASQDFQSFQFTTMSDPRITTLPHTQNFDGVVAPALPVAWTAYKGNTGMSLYTSTTTPYSAPNNVYMSNSSYSSDLLRLITPEITVPLNGSKLSFYARGSGYVLKVGTVSALDGTGVFTELASYTLTSSNTQYVLPILEYAGTDRYICFQHGQGGTYRPIYIDNFRLEEIMENDMAALAVSGPGIGVAGYQLSYNVTVKNNGTEPQASYNVHLKRYGDDRYASLPVNTPLAPGATAVHTLNWTPALDGEYVLVGEVELTGDEFAGNNESATMTTSVYPAGTFLPQIGNIASLTTSNLTPINVYYKNNLSETIYLAHEMQATSGTINAIIYQNNFTQNVTKPIKIWMKHTTAANVSTAFLPFAGYELVFEGNVFMPIGVNAIVIPLDTPFAYTGGNLAVRVYGVWEDFYSLSTNVFYYTSSPEYPSRTRYFQADQTAAFDPIALTDYLGAPFTGIILSHIPNTAFVMSPAVPITSIVAPELSVSQSGVNAQLTWNPVVGAYAYRVYASDDPYLFEGAPIATVYTNTYNAPFATNTKKFYQVIAIGYQPTGRSEVMNPAAVIGFDNSKLRVGATEVFTENKD